MAKYTVTYACGHTGTVDLVGKMSRREWILSQMEKEICPDCLAEQRRLENMKAAEENKKLNLPELSGSEKQILWAEQIRKDIREKLDEYLEQGRKELASGPAPEGIAENLDGAHERLCAEIFSHATAKWFIDHQKIVDKLWDYAALLKAEMDKPTESRIFAPEEPSEKDLVAIRTDKNAVRFECGYDQEFINLVKAFGCKWDDKTWNLSDLSVEYNSLNDAAAYCANELLKAGFMVKIYDPEVQEMLETGQFIGRRTKIIDVASKGTKLKVTGARGEAKDRLLEIKGTKEYEINRPGYINMYVLVPAIRSLELWEFSEIYGFYITPAAEKRMSEIERSIVEKMRPVVPASADLPDGSAADILSSSRDIIDDLRDED